MTVTFVIVSALASFGVSVFLWRAMADVFAAPVLQRQNYAGRTLPVGSGLVIVLASLAVTGVVSAAAVEVVARQQDRLGPAFVAQSLRSYLLLCLGFCLLGLVDDLVGDNDRKGFAGHIGAALHGQVTTGFVKLVGGVLWSYLFVGGGLNIHGLRATLLVAATANLGNLFDRAPGRTIKVAMIGSVVVAACGVSLIDVTGLLMVVAAALGVLVPDLRERCMLGDTGSNVLGAAVGLGLVSALATTGEWIALSVVLGLNLASEKVSFSRVIDQTPPLRRLDRLGSLRD